MWAEGHSLQSGKYQIDRQLGGGGFGLTFLAEDVFLRRSVVIKTPNHKCRGDQDYEKFVRRFQREGQALSRFNHPNIVQVIEYFQEAGMPCLVMSYIEGITLSERIQTQGRLLQEAAVRSFQKLAAVLHTLHQEGLIHCDVHPGNIVIRPNGEPVLIDFGSAKFLQPSTMTVTTTYNESYAPYEQRRLGDSPQATLDIYGLAATMYFAITARRPQPSINRKLYGDKLEPPNQLCEDITDWLNQAIVEGMALEPQDRPSTMAAWATLLHPPKPKISPPEVLPSQTEPAPAPAPSPLPKENLPRPSPSPQPVSVPSLKRDQEMSRKQFLKWGGFSSVGLIAAFGINQTLRGGLSAPQIDYTHLEELLRAGQWKDADQETRNLMLKIANRESSGWLDAESLQDFPCDALAQIDQLWVEASAGKFGFSIQKRIYVEDCGGTSDGKYDETVWNCFADKVRWQVNGDWLNYSEVTFDTTAPFGHLPGVSMGWFCGEWCWWWGAGGGLSSLMWRLEKCET